MFRFEQMHMHAPACPGRSFGNGAQQVVRTPLHAVGAKLHAEHRPFDRRGNGLDPRDLLLRAWHGCEKLRLNHRARFCRHRVQHGRGVSIDQRIAVAHVQGEADADAHIRRSAGDGARLFNQWHRAKQPRVMRHDAAGAGARCAAKSGERCRVRINRRHRAEPQQPDLERLAAAAKRRGRQGPRMVMRVDERGQGEKAPGRGGDCRRDGFDQAVFNGDVEKARARFRPGANHFDTGKHGHDERLPGKEYLTACRIGQADMRGGCVPASFEGSSAHAMGV